MISVLDAASAWMMPPPEGALLLTAWVLPCVAVDEDEDEDEAEDGDEVSPLITERRVCASLVASEFFSFTT